MELDIKRGQRLPFFRLATVGGTSISRDDYLGKPTLYAVWASWDVSRESLSELQSLQETHGAKVQVVSITLDVQGVDYPLRYLRSAHFSFHALIDATCELARLWGVQGPPVLLATHADGTIHYVSDLITAETLAAAVASLDKKIEKPLPEKVVDRAFQKFEVLLQSCTNLLGRGRKEEALLALQEASELKPSKGLLRKQMWAIAHPERFYPGPIDLAWQKQQEDATRNFHAVRKEKK